MIEDRIYLNIQNKLYFVKDNDVFCAECKEAQFHGDRIIIVQRFSRKKRFKIEFLCMGCAKKYSQMYELECINQALVVEKVPANCLHFIPSPPQLQESRCEDVFTASNIPCPIVKDKTKHAGRESWQGVSIGQWEDKPDRIPQTENEVRRLIGLQ